MMDREKMLRCIEDCLQCAGICAHCSDHCLRMGGAHASPDHQGIMRDCAEICAVSASFMARRSRHAEHVCRECADVCRECAQSCERLAEGDSVMTRCAQLCWRCAVSCEAMSR